MDEINCIASGDMLRLPFLYLCAGIIALGISGPASAQLDTLSHDSLVRDYFVHLPPSYDGSAPTPVVIAFHGGFGSAENIERQSGLSDVSDEEGFIAVYPNGTGTIQTWNGGECCGFAANENIDDVGFIRKLIDRLEARFNIEPDQVYATGMSNGAAMSYRLACELSDRIAAIAPVSASYRNPDCQPDRPVPVIHFHSEVDSNVPIEGGVGDGPSNLDWIPLDSTLMNFAVLNNCSFQDSTIANENLVVTTWGGCTNGEAVKYYRTADGGHSWPGGTKTIIGDTVSTAVDASRVMWDFFQQHALTPTSIDYLEPQGPRNVTVDVFPNPTSANAALRVSVPQVSDVSVRIYDVLGRDLGIRLDTIVRASTSTIEIPTATLSAGVYLVQVETHHGTDAILLIKQQ